ncbi:hypothetical protein PVL29_012296 [Vitis rotundifolia]|uniref:ADP/ATP translocase n=1 Tax=Vitis rotundifolia TaxID=103349 RepID=A0AA39DQI8_VITRO|nr:hypothetical protein PVL29_012296 [Vitis rotundifolia]
MADGSQYSLIFHKINGQSYLFSTLSPNLQSRNTSVYSLSSVCVNVGLQTSLLPTSSGNGLALVSPLSPIFAQAPAEKGTKVSAVVSKSTAAPIERVKLLIQNQDEIIKAGRLSELYKGIIDHFARTIKDENIFPYSGPELHFQGLLQETLQFDGYWKWFAGNLVSGGAAGASSLLFVYSLDYVCTSLANDAKAMCHLFFFFFSSSFDLKNLIFK